LAEDELMQLHTTGTALAHCPTSNSFLGSGLLKLKALVNPSRPVRVGLASDIGAGTHLSPLVSMREAYKVAQLTGLSLTALQAFYLSTGGAAHALYLDGKIGAIKSSYEADLTVMNLHSTDLITLRTQQADCLSDILFTQMMLGDERAIAATYIAGKRCYHAVEPIF
jgi:guanine deaminase